MKLPIIVFLFLAFVFMCFIDMSLTEIALADGGFYETNQFTNDTSLEIHFITIIFSVMCLTTFIYVFIGELPTIIFLSFFSVLWLINNIISVYLLRGILF